MRFNVVSNSFYGNSLSSSQMCASQQSIQSLYHEINQQGANLGAFLHDLISDPRLMRKLKTMSQRYDKTGKNINQRYIQILLETIQYVLHKENKVDKDQSEFYEKKKEIMNDKPLHPKQNMRDIIGQVNAIIFSNKLNRISFMLSEAALPEFANLIRIYVAHMNCCEKQVKDGRKDNKMLRYFGKIQYSGKQMIQNICLHYINSIGSKKHLFEESRSPFFRLISEYLGTLFTPVFREFGQIVLKCCKSPYPTEIAFYQQNEAVISYDLADFIDRLPSELIEFLSKLYKITKIEEANFVQNSASISNSHRDNKVSAVTCVKKLLLYSLLVKVDYIELCVGDSVELAQYSEICNLIINLFFRSSIKKFQKTDSESMKVLVECTNLISAKIDQKIMNPEAEDYLTLSNRDSIGIREYLIAEPILNYDYQCLWKWISSIEFTPKDLKEYEIKSSSDIIRLYEEISSRNEAEMGIRKLPQEFESPDNQSRNRDYAQESLGVPNIDSLESQRQEESDIDLATWMTLGGSRNYCKGVAGSRLEETVGSRQGGTGGLKFEKFQLFPQDSVQEIEGLFNEYKKLMEQQQF